MLTQCVLNNALIYWLFDGWQHLWKRTHTKGVSFSPLFGVITRFNYCLVPSYSSLQPFMKYFYKLVTYYMIDYNYNINTWHIKRQVVGYIMSLKRKRRMKLKANNREENKYHLMFNNMLSSDSDLLQSNTHQGCCVLNEKECNYKLMSVIGREEVSDSSSVANNVHVFLSLSSSTTTGTKTTAAAGTKETI